MNNIRFALLVTVSALSVSAAFADEAKAPATPTAPAAAAAAAKDKFKLISVDELDAKLHAKVASKDLAVTVFDVNGDGLRKEKGVIPGAVLLSSTKYDTKILPQNKQTPVVFYCASEKCMASHHAAEVAVEAGFSDVSVLSSGISGWVAAGKATQKPSA